MADPILSPATAPLPDPALEAVAQRVAALVLQAHAPVPQHTDSILTRSEAMAYVKRRSHPAFSAWCKRWGVRPRSRGRWSRHALDRALDREAGPTPLRRHAA